MLFCMERMGNYIWGCYRGFYGGLCKWFYFPALECLMSSVQSIKVRLSLESK